MGVCVREGEGVRSSVGVVCVCDKLWPSQTLMTHDSAKFNYSVAASRTSE